MQETQVLSLGQEDPLEKEMAIHSSIVGESHGQRSLVGLQSMGSQESDPVQQLNHHPKPEASCLGLGNFLPSGLRHSVFSAP